MRTRRPGVEIFSSSTKLERSSVVNLHRIAHPGDVNLDPVGRNDDRVVLATALEGFFALDDAFRFHIDHDHVRRAPRSRAYRLATGRKR